ncbi:MAG TPA: hypothetical protein VMR86_10560 [Myxococcota bacterium]|nr:hypothetical protein [Myxococcota bacterium]
MVAAAGVPAIGRDRPAEPASERFARRPIQLDERPAPLGAPRGIAIAMAMGAFVWALAIVAVMLL